MKKSWLTLILIVVVIIIGIVVFNYQAKKQAAPLSEIFPDEGMSPSDVEYEFVKNDGTPQSQPMPAAATTPLKTQAPQTRETAVSPRFPFGIQVGSFREENKAQQVLQGLKKQYPAAFVLPRDLKDKGIWYRVYVGQFETKSAAETSLTQVKNDYKNSFIVMLPKN